MQVSDEQAARFAAHSNLLKDKYGLVLLPRHDYPGPKTDGSDNDFICVVRIHPTQGSRDYYLAEFDLLDYHGDDLFKIPRYFWTFYPVAYKVYEHRRKMYHQRCTTAVEHGAARPPLAPVPPLPSPAAPNTPLSPEQSLQMLAEVKERHPYLITIAEVNEAVDRVITSQHVAQHPGPLIGSSAQAKHPPQALSPHRPRSRHSVSPPGDDSNVPTRARSPPRRRRSSSPPPDVPGDVKSKFLLNSLSSRQCRRERREAGQAAHRRWTEGGHLA